MLAFDLLLLAVSLPLLLACTYLLIATLCSAKLREPQANAPTRRMRFVVPAHNESAGIAATVRSLLGVDYPGQLFDIVVVADNCNDDTADQARRAGATVLERQNAELRGKGYALDFAFNALPEDMDAVVVIDADTLVSPNILRAFAARRDLGAHAVQADYAVRNPDASWRTRLIAIAFGSFHIVRSRARERLSVSCGLRGNGMCFSASLLKEVPHKAYSVVEDVEYGLRLGRAGYRVFYADEAHVYGEMVTSGGAANSQRRRWEEGRRLLIQQHSRKLLVAAFTERKPVLLDLACDLLIPPLSRLAVLLRARLRAVCGAIFANEFRRFRLLRICLILLRSARLDGFQNRGSRATRSGTGARLRALEGKPKARSRAQRHPNLGAHEA